MGLVRVCEELGYDAGFCYDGSIIGDGGDEAALLEWLVYGLYRVYEVWYAV